MLTRRKFLASAAAAVPLSACADGGMAEYREATARLRAALADDPELVELVRFATLAPNGHNTQPWRFVVGPSGVTIVPDLARRTPVVDPDDHHLFVSLGCAAETLLIAGEARGRPGAIAFDDAGGGRLAVDLARGPARDGDLFRAIPMRQSTRSAFDGRPVPSDDLRQLEAAAAADGVSLRLITHDAGREAVLGHVIAANSIQMDDPAFVRELRSWLRFDPATAMRAGDGLFSACSGNPTAPDWLGRIMFDWFFTRDAENDKYRNQLRSSPGLAVFTADRQDRDHWARVGRSFQRFALKATSLGIRHAHVNQPVEVPSAGAALAADLAMGDARPDLVVRFGYAPPMPMSMRRPADAVIVPVPPGP